MVSTVEGGEGQHTTPAGLPSIVNEDRIKLLFDMQRHVDKLTATTKVACLIAWTCNIGVRVSI